MVFGVIVGLPSLRLRADYFAIATIAMAEVVRLFAQNARDLTGGNQGLVLRGGRPVAAATRTPGATSRTRSTTSSTNFWTDPPTLLPAVPRRLGRRRSSPPSALSYITETPVGPGAAGDPRGRGRRPGARQEHAPVQAPVAGDRGALGAIAGFFLALNLATHPPDRLRAAGHLLRLQRPHPRRPRQLQGGGARGDPVLVRARGDALHRAARPAVHRDPDRRAAARDHRACC